MADMWKIKIYDSFDLLWSAEIPAHRISEKSIRDTVLPRLIAQFLTNDEILRSSMNNRIGGGERYALLDAHIDSTRTYMTGGNPYAVANYVRDKNL